MNSENVLGIRIEWLKPLEQRDYNNLKEGVDFIVWNYYQFCPRTDGGVIDFTGLPNADMQEWLMYAEGKRITDYDSNLFVENEAKRPTNKKNAVLTNYNEYITEYSLVRRSEEEIIKSIRQIENESNLAVQSESDKNKIAMLQPAVTAKLISGKPLDVYEQRVYDRMLEVAQKALINAANAEKLINETKNWINSVSGAMTPDLKSGWEIDNITSLGYPFDGND